MNQYSSIKLEGKEKVQARRALIKLLTTIKSIEPGTETLVFLPTIVDIFDLDKICKH